MTSEERAKEVERAINYAERQALVDYQLRSSFSLEPARTVPEAGRRVGRKPSLDELDGMEKR